MNNKIFLKKFIDKFEANIFTLLLVPFVSESINYSRHSESSESWKNTLMSANSLFERKCRLFLLVDQFGHKREQKRPP